MAQNEPKVEILKDIPRKEEFQKYLEKAGVIDQLTKLLVSLYENPDRPENALDYIKNFLGANAQNANVESSSLSIKSIIAYSHKQCNRMTAKNCNKE